MKVQVIVKTSSENVTSKCEVDVLGAELVKELKQKVAASQLIAFPKQRLVLGGQTLEDDVSLTDVGVVDAASLEFIIEATETVVVDQLKELLRSRDLTYDELGLLYCYKHGVSINQALKTLGCDMSFTDFVKAQKEFVVQDCKVSLVRGDTKLKPVSCTDELARILKNNGGAMDITQLCAKFLHEFHMSVSSMVSMRPTEFLESEKATFVLLGRGKVGLKGVVRQPSKPSAKGAFPQPTVIKGANPLPSKADLFKEAMNPRSKQGSPPKNKPAVSKTKVEKDSSRSDQMYQELHTRISARGFNSRIANTLNNIVELVKDRCFLDIEEVVKAGSVGNGTAVEGCTDASLVFFVKGLPNERHALWMPPLLRSVKATLESSLPQEMAQMELLDDSLRLTVQNDVSVSLKFAPVFKSHAALVTTLGNQGPEARKHFEPAFAKQASSFVQKQSGSVKVTIRLLKWWVDQQEWSCELTRPSNAILELVAIYAAQQKPRNQQQAIANCMALLARFKDLRILWSNYYQSEDIWEPLLLQRPLLMDPVNPFVNVADPQFFDPREVMEKAATTHFFW